MRWIKNILGIRKRSYRMTETELGEKYEKMMEYNMVDAVIVGVFIGAFVVLYVNVIV